MHLNDADDDPLRAFVLGLPPYREWTPEQRAEYDRRLDTFNEAARAREAEDEPEPVAA